MEIQSVKRATDIISLFSAAQPQLGITQIATALELNKATAWGIVSTLEKQGFLQQDPETHKYSVGSKLFELGMVYFERLEVNSRASRPAHDLAGRTGLVARVGIWDRDSVLITLMALPKAEDSLSHQIGPRIPAYCSGIGKALLAFLDPEVLAGYLEETPLIPHTRATILCRDQLEEDLARARVVGYSVSREEMIPGLVALGAPVYGRGRKLAGAISIGGAPASNEAQIAWLGEELLRTASEISWAMGCYRN